MYTDKIGPDLSANMFVDKGFNDQIRYVAYVPGMAGNLADSGGFRS